MPDESVFTVPSAWCPNPSQWHSPDGFATETEVSELIRALIIAQKPQVVVEIGTYLGHTAKLIGESLKINGSGHLWTIDYDEGFLNKAKELCEGLPITFILGDARTWEPPDNIDFFWNDVGQAEPDTRKKHLERFMPKFSAGAIAAIHDTAPHHTVWHSLRPLIESGQLVMINLRTPRGLGIAQVPFNDKTWVHMKFGEEFKQHQRLAWSWPPMDDVGYMSSEWMLTQLKDDDFRRLVDAMTHSRYKGWRNNGGKWRDLMGLDSLHNKFITDFGCGNGIESLELAKAGNKVTLADISPANLEVANKIFHLYGYKPVESFLVGMNPPYFPDHRMDVFYANGVIHHIPWADEVMQRAHDNLPADGEARLMLYSDVGWRQVVGTDPPEDTSSDPDFIKFVRHFDQVGEYADWYSVDKIHKHFKGFRVERWDYLTENDRYLAAILRKE
jgi:SAM-dependent methyltransferase